MHRNPSRQRRGNAAWTALTAITLIGFAALAVDIGHLRVVQAELQNASDAAAESAVPHLDGTTDGLEAARDAAVAFAAANASDGASVVVDRNDGNDPNGDVVLGIWDGSAFTPSTDPDDVNAVRVRARRSGVLGFFSPAAFGVQTMDASARAIATAGESGGAGATDCFLPFALPICIFDGASDATLNLTDLRLQPATGDNIGWANPHANPTPSDIYAQLNGQCAGGEVAIGGDVYLGNGAVQSALTYVADAVNASDTSWRSDAWGTQPAAMSGSAITSWGRTLEGPIILFDGGPEYCDSDAATGNWNQTATIAGFAWGAIYDVKLSGSAASRNVKMRLELLDEYEFGTVGGGPDHGVTFDRPPALVY